MNILKFILVISVFTLNFFKCEEDEHGDSTKAETDINQRTKIQFSAPIVSESTYLALYFDGPTDMDSVLIKSSAKKDGVESTISKYDGQWAVEIPANAALDGDYALVLKSKARHHAVSSKLKRTFDFATSAQLVIQYEVKFLNGLDCGGAYIKLLSQQTPPIDLELFNDKTSYTIMFGPDKCGLDQKLHFIFRFQNPVTGKYEEKHMKKPKADLDRYFTDKKTHLYTLVINEDNSFQVLIDQSVVSSGTLLDSFEPSVNPPREVDDPTDHKPADWDEREKIPDPMSVKPADWDESQPETVVDESAVKPAGWLDTEPRLIPDPGAEKPKDWDAEMDGEWEAPQIDNPRCTEAPGCGEWKPPTTKNPLYKGKWSPPIIDNPAYKGVWKPRRIPNQHYFEEAQPFRRLDAIQAVGFELWSMTDEIVFDNLLIAGSRAEAEEFAAATWQVKKDEERRADPKSQSVVDAVQEMTREKPWIWAIVVLVIGLPTGLLVYYCCCSGGGGEGESSRANNLLREEAGRRKKTDAVSPDAPIAAVNKASLESSSEGEADKSQAEEEEEEEADKVEEPTKEAQSTGSPKSANRPHSPVEENSQGDCKVDGNPDLGSPKSSGVKKRSRKDL